MNIAFGCVLIAALIPYCFVSYSKATSEYLKQGNQAPRRYAEGLNGPRQRAYWAHQNGFEAFPPFAAAVIIAVMAGVDRSTVDALALTFVGARLAYGLLYIADLDKLRSAAWMVGMACICALFVLGVTA